MPTKKPAKAAPKAAAKAIPFEKLPVLTQLAQLADWLATTPLEEVEVKQGDLRLRLKKPGSGLAMPVAANAAAFSPAQPAATTATTPEAPKTTINAPMVGTFYRAPGPNAPAFINEGDTVAVGQVIGIIEAMKTMNQITADKAGKVAQIVATNAQPVEYGQPLIILA